MDRRRWRGGRLGQVCRQVVARHRLLDELGARHDGILFQRALDGDIGASLAARHTRVGHRFWGNRRRHDLLEKGDAVTGRLVVADLGRTNAVKGTFETIIGPSPIETECQTR